VLTNGAFGAGYGITGNLALGFKADRVVGLLTLSFIDVSGGGAGNSSPASFTLGPDFQFAIVRSEDKRVELLGDVGISFGHVFGSMNNGNPGFGPVSFPSNLAITYQFGLGGRYWFHPHFALQGLTGFGGEAFIDLDASSGTTSAHGAFASLGILSVF
jgi:hypothetical protein